MTDLLSGQILWVSREQLTISGALTGILLVAMWLFRRSDTMFYALFAVAITLSVQMVGVYLVFATLIIPALSTVRIAHQKRRLQVAMGWRLSVAPWVLLALGCLIYPPGR